MKVLILNGPNLNLLGSRQPEIYGHASFDTFLSGLYRQFPDISFSYFQSNVEGEIINQLHASMDSVDAVILNAGAYTHTSVAISDAVAAIGLPVIEVHISNIYAREEFRHTSLLAKHCRGIITGFGLDSYRLAVEAIIGIQKS